MNTQTIPSMVSASALKRGDVITFNTDPAVIEDSKPSAYPGLLTISYRYLGNKHIHTARIATTQQIDYLYGECY